jgi:stage II sporulation protein AA (anti-sigma F factor antagonist)
VHLSNKIGGIILQVKFTNKSTTLVITIAGELDHHSSEYVRQKIDSELIKSTTKNVVFDFSKVTFMDSSGIGVVMGRYKNIQQWNGQAAVANVSPQIRRVFEMSGLQKLIPVYESVDEAFNNM